jgi:hypothetical protein
MSLVRTQDAVSRVVVAEYPKSGGSWLVSMLGDALGQPKRDIYVADGYRAFDIAKHPWYQHAESWNVTDACVIKSHELPDSPLSQTLAGPQTATIHLIRDGRDVTVSKYFFERDFCVRNGILPALDLTFTEFVTKTATEWRAYVEAWAGKADLVCRYETFLADPVAGLTHALAGLRLPTLPEAVTTAVERNTKEKLARSLDATFAHNTFVRVATAGDWRNHFTPQDREEFRRIAGPLLVDLGYATDGDAW